MQESNKKVLVEVEVAVKEAIANLAKTRKEILDLKKAQKELDTTTEEGRKQYEVYNTQIRELNESARQQQKQIDNNIKAQKSEVGSLTQLRATISNLKAEYSALSKEQRDSPVGEAMAKQIKEMNDELKSAEGGFGDFYKSVGDYQTAIKSALGLQDGFIGNLVNMATGAKDAGTSFGTLLTSGVKSAGKALLSLLANPIIAIIAGIVAVVTGLYNVFKDFAPIVDIVEQGMAALSAVFRTIKESVIGLITGQKSLIDTFKNLGGSMREAAQEAVNLKKAQQDLDDLNRVSSVNQSKYKNLIDELLLQSKNRTLSEKERMALIDQALKVERDAYLEKKMIADEEVKIAQESIINGRNLTNYEIQQLKKRGVAYALWLQNKKGISDEEIETLKNALIKQNEVENESISLREKAMNRRDQLADKEAENSEKNRQKQKELTSRNAKAELDIENLKSQAIIDKQNEIANNEKNSLKIRTAALYSSESEQKKIIEASSDFELKNEGLTAEKIKLIREGKYDINKLTKTQKAIVEKYNYDVAKLHNDTQQRITEVEKAEVTKRLKILSDSLNDQNRKASVSQSNDLENLSKWYADKMSNMKLDEDQIIKIKQEYEQKKVAIAKKYSDEEFNNTIGVLQEQLKLYLEGSDEYKAIAKQIADTQANYATQSAQIAIKANEDIANSHDTSHKKMSDNEKKFADLRKQLYSQLLTTISDITGGYYESQYQKIDEEKQRTTDAYDDKIKAAEKAGKDTTSIEASKQAALDKIEKERKKKEREKAIADRLLAVFNIGISTAQGIAATSKMGMPQAIPFIIMESALGALQLASVLAQPLPKASKGMLLNGPSHAQGGIPIEAEGGEAIINKRSTAMFAPLLSTINQLGGGAKFASGGIVSSTYIYPDGGYAARNLGNGNSMNKDEFKQAMKEALSEMKPQRIAIEDIRKADKKYTDIEGAANF